MGRRKNRKAERRQGQRQVGGADAFLYEPDAFEAWLAENPLPPPDPDEAVMALIASLDEPRATPANSCGTCREFVPGAEFGRGQCLHPGSGVFSPWEDTAACAFYSGSGRRRDLATRY